MSSAVPTLESLDVCGKTVLVRLDLNVPMQGGRVRDATRITRSIPTLQYLLEKNAKVAVISHLGRPKGFDPGQSLAPLVDALSSALWDRPVKFAPDCVGSAAQLAVENAQPGDVILMENLRFHSEETGNDESFGKALASLADVYVNDAFSCSHRAHASIVGVVPHLPSAAGRLLQQEVDALTKVLADPERPLCAIVGGSKISTKLELLGNLTERVDYLVVGGAMANTFLLAQGHDMGASLVEKDMLDTAREIMKTAESQQCRIVLPTDAVVAQSLAAQSPSRICDVTAIPKGEMILDIGPDSIAELFGIIRECKTLVWNGPLGAYEIAPFDSSTTQLARIIAKQSRAGALHSVAGGGDTLAALSHASLASELSYLSTAGGAFLEWLEGKTLPGIQALMDQDANPDRAIA